MILMMMAVMLSYHGVFLGSDSLGFLVLLSLFLGDCGGRGGGGRARLGLFLYGDCLLLLHFLCLSYSFILLLKNRLID